MAEERPVPQTYSWVADLMSKIPAYTFMAGMFVYWVLVVSPAREAWWWEQLQEHEQKQAEARTLILGRQDIAIKEIETNCYGVIADNRRMTIENKKIITDMHAFQLAQRDVLIGYGKILDDVKTLIERDLRKAQ